jgi:hypothetical protein
MSRCVHIDRQDELQLFQDVLDGRRDERILLVEAQSGLGKTQLLLEYRRLAGELGAPCAALDLRLTGVTGLDVLAALREEWDECPFHGLRDQVEKLTAPDVKLNVSGVVQIGRPEINLALNSPDEATRRQRLRQLTEALARDLRAWLEERGQRGVILVDTYNLATSELRQWFEGVLLPHVRRVPNLVAVVAGQEPLPLTAAWEDVCHRLRLQLLLNPDDWMEFVRAKAIPVSREAVSVVCHVCAGRPGEIAMKLDMLKT